MSLNKETKPKKSFHFVELKKSNNLDQIQFNNFSGLTLTLSESLVKIWPKNGGALDGWTFDEL